MLGVTCVHDRSAAYYLADLALEVAAVRGAGAVGAPGRWRGRGAAGLGWSGPVETDGLRLALSGCSPGSGRRLVRRTGSVCGYDLTISAPKPASVLFALGGNEVAAGVLDAHEASVSAVVQYVESHAMGVRRGSGASREVLPASGMVAASFTHGLSRASDPHLHTHLVVANVARGVDGRWSAIDGRGLYAHAPAAGALYEADFRRRLSDDLGVEWTRAVRGHTIAGLDPVLVGCLSGRAAEIRANLAERGLNSTRARRVAWAATREPKPAAGDGAALSALWGQRARVAGFEHADVRTVLGRRRGRDDGLDEYRFAAALSVRPGGVARRDVLQAWSHSLPDGAAARELTGCVDLLVAPDGRVGVGEPLQARRSVVPGQVEIGLLGTRPSSAAGLALWQDAAGVVSAYRTRWGTSADLALRQPADLAVLGRLPPAQLADHVACGRRLDEFRRRLGRDHTVVGRDLRFERGFT